MGICELELRKQDVVGEQWSRAVYEDTVMLAELDPQRLSMLDPSPWPYAPEAAGPAPLSGPASSNYLSPPYALLTTTTTN